MFKIAGHTMGTPEYTVTEAIELFSKIGAEGAEIVVQDDYRSGLPCECGKDTLQKVKQCAKDHGIQIVCLTPYNSKFNSLDEEVRQAEIKGIEKVIEYCDFLGAGTDPDLRRQSVGRRRRIIWKKRETVSLNRCGIWVKKQRLTA